MKGKISALPGTELRFSGVSTRSLIAILTRCTVPVVKTTCKWRTQKFCSGGGGSTNSVEYRGSGGGSRIFRGSGGSCNLVLYKKFHFM